MAKAKATRKKKEQYVMSPSELDNLRQEIQDNKNVLKTAEDYGHGIRASEMLDKGAIKRSIKKYDAMIEKYSPHKMTGATKDKLAKRSKELAEFIKEGMPTREEMMDLKNNPGAPRKNLMWERQKAAAVHEWKQCQRRLEPGDPTSSSIERLRRVR